MISPHILPVPGGNLPLTIARGGGAGAAVVIMPSAFGIGPALEAQMEELAADARAVVALDPFHRSDPGPAPHDDMTRAMARIGAIDPERMHDELRAAIAWSAAETGRAPVVLGICFGGAYAMESCTDGGVAGVVTWHGTWLERHLDDVAAMRAPMRHHVGGADPFVPPAAVAALRAAFARRDDVRVIVHDGLTHGFTQRAAASHDAAGERAAMGSVRELVTIA